jgi:hypothetical protein
MGERMIHRNRYGYYSVRTDYDIMREGTGVCLRAVIIGIAVALLLLLLAWGAGSAQAEGVVDVPRLAEAIRHAEGVRSRHPYGILSVYCSGDECRQVCVRTIKHRIRAYHKDRGEIVSLRSFVAYLGATYAPVPRGQRPVSNDPHGLNRNWTKNVLYWYNKLNKGV